MFFREFCKTFKNIFWQNISGWLLPVFICEFREVFQITSFIDHLWETSYFMYKLQNLHQIQYKFISREIFKLFIREQEVAIRRRSFTWNSWKLFVKKLICNEVSRCQPAGLQKTLFHTSCFMYFAFIFSECITITSSKEAFKVREHNFFQEI